MAGTRRRAVIADGRGMAPTKDALSWTEIAGQPFTIERFHGVLLVFCNFLSPEPVREKINGPETSKLLAPW